MQFYSIKSPRFVGYSFENRTFYWFENPRYSFLTISFFPQNSNFLYVFLTISWKSFCNVFFWIFVYIFFSREMALKRNFNEKIENICRKSKNLRRFFPIFPVFWRFLPFFLDFRLEFFFTNRLQENVTFLKSLKNFPNI